MEKVIMNRKNKRGFTLVELIVVLVILAILASLLIPALTGYVTKAKKQNLEMKFLLGMHLFRLNLNP